MTTAELARPSRPRRLFGWLYRHPRIQLGALLVAPVGWFGIVYFGSLALLFAYAFWSLDPQTGEVVKQFTLANFQRMIEQPVYGTIVLRTVGVAAVVTIADALIAFPIAYYMARVASPRRRGAPVHVGPPAALGELPRQGLRLAGDPGPERAPRLGAPARRASTTRPRSSGSPTCR